jgi:hypothetical protein
VLAGKRKEKKIKNRQMATRKGIKISKKNSINAK